MENQKLIRNLKAYEFAIKMIKFDLDIKTQTYNKIINLCYKFLILFCLDNNENQEIIQSHIYMFLDHLKSNPKTLCFFLIKTLFKNNKVFRYILKTFFEIILLLIYLIY